MSIHCRDAMVHVDFVDGKLDLSTYVSNWCDDDEEMQAVIDGWKGDSETGIGCHFTLASILDDIIGMHAMPAYGSAIDADTKPIFDTMRAELAAMIERIDALTFARTS